MSKKPLDLSRYQSRGSGNRPTALDALIAAAPSEVADRAAELGLPLKHLPTDQIAPDLQQLRRLAHPEDLLREAERGDRASTALVTELRTLAQSIREHGQLQPIIVYPDRDDPRFPGMTHRIVMGQRRWSAAILSQLPTLWVVEVERPSGVNRILHQYDENEQREGLSDMERAWALQSLKGAMEEEQGGTVPWNVVEARIQISPQRRYDLMRLFRFSEEAQKLIARYRWSEWTLRNLHMAISADEIDQQTATTILRELADLEEVNATIVRSIVERYLPKPAPVGQFIDSDGDGGSGGSASTLSSGGHDIHLSGITKKIDSYRRGLDKLTSQVSSGLNEPERTETLRHVEQLMDSLEKLLEQLRLPRT
jgi:ParB/RepB/Spo0J family partition protein